MTSEADSHIGADIESVQLKKKELLDAVVTRTGLKKRDVKPAVEAAFAILSETLSKGEGVVLPPLGKMRVVRAKDLGDGAQVLTLKLRTMKNASSDVVVKVDEHADES